MQRGVTKADFYLSAQSQGVLGQRFVWHTNILGHDFVRQPISLYPDDPEFGFDRISDPEETARRTALRPADFLPLLDATVGRL